MADRTQREHKGVHGWSTDALIWNVIGYLDSPSDYREYLPYTAQRDYRKQIERRERDRRKNIQPFQKEPMPQKKESEIHKSDLVLLDNIPDHWWPRLRLLTLVVFLFCVLLLALLRS